MSQYTVLVVGMGKRGVHHATAFHSNPKFKVVGICDIDQKRLDDAAPKIGNPEKSLDAGALAKKLKPDLFCFCTLPNLRLDFIKMDVQGWEGQALRGVAGLLDANPGLQIYFEFWPHGLRLAGTEIAELAATLRELRLHVTLADATDQTTPVDLLALDRGMKPKAFTNLLARR